MRKIRKKLLALALAICLLPSNSVMAATKTVDVTVRSGIDTVLEATKVWHIRADRLLKKSVERCRIQGNSRLLKKTGAYNVRVKYEDARAVYANANANIVFRAPKAGVYTVELSNLHSSCKDDSQTCVRIGPDGRWLVSQAHMKAMKGALQKHMEELEEAYQAGDPKVSKAYYERRMGELEEFMEYLDQFYFTESTIDVKLRKGEYLVTVMRELEDADGTSLYTLNALSFNMKISYHKK